MERISRISRFVLRIAVIVLTLIYPGFMAVMSAAGWMYNVENGSYPELFRAFAGWMYAGSAMLCAGTVLAMVGAKPKRWVCSAAGAVLGCLGCTACLSVLYRFCAYADQNFSGIGEEMQPVSELYRGRLLPILAAAVLLVILCVWQCFTEEARDFRAVRRREKAARENAPAPKILGD